MLINTNADYLQVFQQLGAWALGGALFLYLLSKKIGGFIDSADEVDDDSKEMAST